MTTELTQAFLVFHFRQLKVQFWFRRHIFSRIETFLASRKNISGTGQSANLSKKSIGLERRPKIQGNTGPVPWGKHCPVIRFNKITICYNIVRHDYFLFTY